MEQEGGDGGIHVFEVIRSLGLRPQWVREQIGMTLARWNHLTQQHVPWREEELQALLALFRRWGERVLSLTRDDLIDPGALVLQPGEYHRRRR